ncbi:DUF423 domain-containing protein [Stenotrophomonas sp. YIM B06876]|uniref:DUF423 domain-containing protein n=1 Tax=Stenotrophomonas sp. YIM B06876 TaxID=3060211 RepID=UPI002738E4BF|nr:DUF423 domain-containing protein [Stenotrophomonas sp. YIM B06876]
MPVLELPSRRPFVLAGCGALLAAAAIGLSAYASHGIADAQAQSQVTTAALYAFGHGIALAALGRLPGDGVTRVALCGLLLGTLLFSGSLVGGALWHASMRLAPVGGMTLMAAWAVYALAALRR